MILPTLGSTYHIKQVPDYLLELENQGLLKFSQYRLVVCSDRVTSLPGERLEGCGTDIKYPTRNTQEDNICCENCGNEYTFEELLDQSKVIKELTKINYADIENKILEEIEKCKVEINKIDVYSGNYVLKYEDKEYLLLFGHIKSNQTSILEATKYKAGVIYIQLSKTIDLVIPETTLVFSGLNILQHGFRENFYILRDLPTAENLIAKLQKINNVEKEILQKTEKLSWQVVENDVANFFIDQLRSRVVEKYKYRVLLDQFPHFSRIPVNAAGAGNPDKITINLSDYLQEFFDIEFTADIKRYTSTSVNHSTIEKVLHHLSKNQNDARRVIIIATTNNVTCWDDVASYKTSTGKYKLIIFTARLIAEVAVHLDFSDELLDVIKSLL